MRSASKPAGRPCAPGYQLLGPGATATMRVRVSEGGASVVGSQTSNAPIPAATAMPQVVVLHQRLRSGLDIGTSLARTGRWDSRATAAIIDTCRRGCRLGRS